MTAQLPEGRATRQRNGGQSEGNSPAWPPAERGGRAGIEMTTIGFAAGRPDSSAVQADDPDTPMLRRRRTTWDDQASSGEAARHRFNFLARGSHLSTGNRSPKFEGAAGRSEVVRDDAQLEIRSRTAVEPPAPDSFPARCMCGSRKDATTCVEVPNRHASARPLDADGRDQKFTALHDGASCRSRRSAL